MQTFVTLSEVKIADSGHVPDSATARLAYGDMQLQFGSLSERQRRLGFTTGAGMDVGLIRHWSACAEYLFNDLSDRGYGLIGANNGFDANLLRFDVNYRF